LVVVFACIKLFPGLVGTGKAVFLELVVLAATILVFHASLLGCLSGQPPRRILCADAPNATEGDILCQSVTDKNRQSRIAAGSFSDGLLPLTYGDYTTYI
jgi:hypothetical protein